jgi:transmembrane sensor
LAAWRKGELHFDHTPASEVFDHIEDTYGYKIVIKDQAILKKTLSGTFISTNENVFFNTLSTALGITIQRSADNRSLIINSK